LGSVIEGQLSLSEYLRVRTVLWVVVVLCRRLEWSCW
jgi:hypothetical protein